MDVLNTTSEGFWLQVEGRVGVDAGSVIGATSDPGEDGVWQDIMKAMGRWGIKQLERVSVELSTINVSAAHDPSIVLAFIDVSPLELPLTAAPPPGDLSWLTKVSTPLLIRSTRDTGAIIRFVRQAWRDGTVAVQAEMERAIVTGGGLTGTSWRQRLSIEREDIQLNIQMKSKCSQS